MFLHDDKEAFTELVLSTSQEMKVDPVLVEKDYFVSMTLKKILERFEDIVFRGGTALSKCYEIIDRLSEDIDISVEGHMTDGRRKILKNAIVDSITEVNLELFNLQETRSRRSYNKYIAKYESIYSDITTIKSEIIVETYLATQPFPTKRLPVGNIIYKSLEKLDRLDVARQFDLFPFEMMVQDERRTFIDKTFALCDYFLSNETAKHSRHIYDLYMLDKIIKIDAAFKDLVKQVREERCKIPVCISAKSGIVINDVLSDIIKSEAFKKDYYEITEKLLYRVIPYEIAVKQLDKIIESNSF